MIAGILGYWAGNMEQGIWGWFWAGVAGIVGAAIVVVALYLFFWFWSFPERLKAAKEHIQHLERKPIICFADSLIPVAEGYLLAVTNCGPGGIKAYVSLEKVEWNQGSAKISYKPISYLRWQGEYGDYSEEASNAKDLAEHETKYLHVFELTGSALINESLHGFEGRFLAHNSKRNFGIIGLYDTEITFEIQLFGNPPPLVAATKTIKISIPQGVAHHSGSGQRS